MRRCVHKRSQASAFGAMSLILHLWPLSFFAREPFSIVSSVEVRPLFLCKYLGLQALAPNMAKGYCSWFSVTAA